MPYNLGEECTSSFYLIYYYFLYKIDKGTYVCHTAQYRPLEAAFQLGRLLSPWRTGCRTKEIGKKYKLATSYVIKNRNNL